MVASLRCLFRADGYIYGPEFTMFSAVALALLLAVSPAYAGKKKAPPPEPPPAAAPAEPPIDPAFEADIRKLLAVTGAGALGQQVMDQMFTALKPMAPALPPEFWDDVKKEMNADELVELVVPIYARHLTHEDVIALVAFYETPVGKKMIAVQPALVAESMQVGQAWGVKVGAKLVEKIQAQGGQSTPPAAQPAPPLPAPPPAPKP